MHQASILSNPLYKPTKTLWNHYCWWSFINLQREIVLYWSKWISEEAGIRIQALHCMAKPLHCSEKDVIGINIQAGVSMSVCQILLLHSRAMKIHRPMFIKQNSSWLTALSFLGPNQRYTEISTFLSTNRGRSHAGNCGKTSVGVASVAPNLVQGAETKWGTWIVQHAVANVCRLQEKWQVYTQFDQMKKRELLWNTLKYFKRKTISTTQTFTCNLLSFHLCKYLAPKTHPYPQPSEVQPGHCMNAHQNADGAHQNLGMVSWSVNGIAWLVDHQYLTIWQYFGLGNLMFLGAFSKSSVRFSLCFLPNLQIALHFAEFNQFNQLARHGEETATSAKIRVPMSHSHLSEYFQAWTWQIHWNLDKQNANCIEVTRKDV